MCLAYWFIYYFGYFMSDRKTITKIRLNVSFVENLKKNPSQNFNGSVLLDIDLLRFIFTPVFILFVIYKFANQVPLYDILLVVVLHCVIRSIRLF